MRPTSRTLTTAALVGVLAGAPILIGCGLGQDPVSGAGRGAGADAGGAAADDADDEDAPDRNQDGLPDGDGRPVPPGGGLGGGSGGAPPPVEPSGAPRIEIVGLEQATAAGGTPSTTLTSVGRPAPLEELLDPLTDPELSMAVRRRVGEASMSGDPYAAIASVGCDVPPGIDVYPVRGGWGIAPKPAYHPTLQCSAPITTVVVVSVSGG